MPHDAGRAHTLLEPQKTGPELSSQAQAEPGCTEGCVIMGRPRGPFWPSARLSCRRLRVLCASPRGRVPCRPSDCIHSSIKRNSSLSRALLLLTGRARPENRQVESKCHGALGARGRTSCRVRRPAAWEAGVERQPGAGQCPSVPCAEAALSRALSMAPPWCPMGSS